MSIIDDIRQALDAALDDVSGLPAIAHQNAPFSESPNDAYLRTRLTVTSRRPAVTGGSPQQRYQGLYTITIATPVDIGTGVAFGYADTLLAAFDASTDIVGSSVTVSIEYSELGTDAVSGPFFLLPVQVAWYVYAQ